jgi:hypothetical protein
MEQARSSRVVLHYSDESGRKVATYFKAKR